MVWTYSADGSGNSLLSVEAGRKPAGINRQLAASQLEVGA